MDGQMTLCVARSVSVRWQYQGSRNGELKRVGRDWGGLGTFMPFKKQIPEFMRRFLACLLFKREKRDCFPNGRKRAYGTYLNASATQR